MSILLIGQRNRFYSSQKPKFLDYQQAEDYKRYKKNTQEQYRKQLIEQMNDSSQRKRRQRQRQKLIDMKYEKIFYDQLTDYQQRIQNENGNHLFTHKRNQSQIGMGQSSIKPQRKQHELVLPVLNNQFNAKRSKISRLQTQPTNISVPTRPIQRLHTDFHRYEQKFNRREDDEWESVETRQKKLQDKLEEKLKEVYQLMAHSVKQFNQSQELQKIGAKLEPIRLNLQKQYKVKYPQPVNPQFNAQPKQDYYKLPNINQPYSPVYQSDAEWRQWYAKQKLRQLEARYKKELDLQPSQLKLFSRRPPTPKFKTELYGD